MDNNSIAIVGAFVIITAAYMVITQLTIRSATRFLSKKLDRITNQGETEMAGIADVQSAQTTLHEDLVAENGLIKQLLTAFAEGTLTPAQAQTLVDGMNADDADAKSNVAAITAVLPH